jgi:hypothetical protein
MSADRLDLASPMEGIPPARASDNEDVIWALETAESLWKRDSRVDAIVWLRRAAQEAADAGDDERAASLLADATGLADAMARISTQTRAAQPASLTPPAGDDDIDALLAGASEEAARPTNELEASQDDIVFLDEDAMEELDESDLVSFLPPTPVPPPLVLATPVPTGDSATDAPIVHAAQASTSTAFLAGSLTSNELAGEVDAAATAESVDELLASVAMEAAAAPPEPERPTAVPERVTAPPPGLDAAPPSDAPTRIVMGGADEHAEEPVAASPEDTVEVEGITRLGADALSPLDLAGVPALAKLSDAQRARLVQAASVVVCMADVELPDFELVLVLDGEVSVRTGASGALITRLGPGAVLRAHGTLASDPLAASSAGTPRFVVTADDSTLALWSAARLAKALADAPDTDEELRAQGDKLVAWTAVAESAMAMRLHEDVRLRLFERLTARSLAAGVELVKAGDAVRGILLVGAGSIVVDQAAGSIGPGEFVFAEATLSAAKCKAAARAGAAGAVVLCADRQTTQELWATEPLLLELLAGG